MCEVCGVCGMSEVCVMRGFEVEVYVCEVCKVCRVYEQCAVICVR